ncbi:MAG: ATP-binding protein [Acidobacteriota bacterium]|nr:ATP-binding protein [Acidobacteriota bacterium]
MEKFRRQFLLDSVKNLKNLQNNLRSAEKFSDAEKREVFRYLHTIKGTAQIFGFASISRLAHELENLLSARQIISNENFKSLFTEGFKLLINSFEQKDFEFPAQFVDKIKKLIPQKNQSVSSANYLPAIPPEILASLSRTEKIAFDSALRNGNSFFCFEVKFDLANFTNGFKNFRETLSQSGEIIATLPSTNFNGNGKIGFQIFFASSAKTSNIEKIAETYAADIILNTSSKNFTNDLPGILSKIVAHGENLASKLGKEIGFEVFADEINLSAEKLRLVFDILLHLTRNAIDHAIEKKGKIGINIKADENGFRLIFTDNGSGIDLEKVRAKAIEKNLIPADTVLTEQAALDFIFQPEFSTSREITEISGRGIGLDAVKDAVEKAGGKISVQSQIEKGTTFEIFCCDKNIRN